MDGEASEAQPFLVSVAWRLQPNGRLHHLLLTAFRFGFIEENYVFLART
jgi:hypothetical protein